MNDLSKIAVFSLLIIMSSQGRADTAKINQIRIRDQLVTIFAGSKAGLNRGTKVCFYRNKRARKKVGCGTVVKLLPYQAQVNLSRVNILKIKKTYIAKFIGRNYGRRSRTKIDKLHHTIFNKNKLCSLTCGSLFWEF